MPPEEFMRFHRLVAAAFACAAMLCVHESSAGTRPIKLHSLAGVPVRKVYLPGVNATQDVCRLGQYGDPVGAVGDESNGGTIFFGEGDTYWTYLELPPMAVPDVAIGANAVHVASGTAVSP